MTSKDAATDPIDEVLKDPVDFAFKLVHTPGSNPKAALPILEPLLATFTDDVDIVCARAMISEGYIYQSLENGVDKCDVGLFEKGVKMIVDDVKSSGGYPKLAHKVLKAYERAGRTEDVAKWSELFKDYEAKWRELTRGSCMCGGRCQQHK